MLAIRMQPAFECGITENAGSGSLLVQGMKAASNSGGMALIVSLTAT